MPKKANNPDSEPAVQSAKIISRRGLIGVIIAAVITACGVIGAASINSCGSAPKPGPQPTSLSFIGRVFNKSNPEETVRNAQVSLEGAGAPPLATTDSKGIFSFPLSEPNKEFRLRIEAGGYDAFDLRVVPANIQGIQPIPLTPKAETKADLSGTVLDRNLNDKPVQGAKVTLDDVPGMQPVETSTDGVFTFKEVPKKYGESVRIRVIKDGYQPNPYTEDVILGKAPPRIRLIKFTGKK